MLSTAYNHTRAEEANWKVTVRTSMLPTAGENSSGSFSATFFRLLWTWYH
ncbi:rCG58504 [Rattus norvegicus]|uniref:RCG58504 n=1 Tax=Rattus norvegicus TaxID=10116 RepID=A6K6W5_RAT|nr:rCG58504 [Rattus norvegicus]